MFFGVVNVNIIYLVDFFILLFYFLPFKALINVVELPGSGGHTPLLPALGKQRQVALCEFEDSLVYRANSSIAREAQRNLVSEKRKKEEIKSSQEILIKCLA